MIEAPYHSIHHALTEAYRLESECICKTSSYIADLRQSGLRGNSYYDTPWDKFAQAAMLLRFVKDHCHNMLLLECRYRIPTNKEQQKAKLQAARQIALAIDVPHDKFTTLCIAEWGGMPVSKGWVRTWAKRLKAPERTLYNRRSRIFKHLHDMECQTLNPLIDDLVEAGLISA